MGKSQTFKNIDTYLVSSNNLHNHSSRIFAPITTGQDVETKLSNLVRKSRIFPNFSADKSPQSCKREPKAIVKGYSLTGKYVYYINFSCRYWGPDGSAGSNYSALIKNETNGDFSILWETSEFLYIWGTYIADLDSNGDVEAFLSKLSGVAGSVSIVEFSSDGKYVPIKFVSSSSD